MNCQSCGSILPQDAQACPNCGTRTPAYYSIAGDIHAPTAISGEGKGQGTGTPYPSQTPYTEAQTPYTGYGTNPYGQTANPYGTTAPPPPPPKRRRPMSVFIGAALLVVVLLGMGLFVILSHLQSSGGSSNNSSSAYTTATEAPTSESAPTPLPPQQAQTLYDQTITRSPTLNDPLSAPDNFGWDNKTLDNTSCTFIDGAYHSKATPGYFSPCYASATNFSNFLFQAEITIIDGHSGGLVFRADKTNDKSYLFRISTDGTYILNKYTLGSDNQLKSDTLSSGQTAEMKTGLNQANLLSVLVRGNDIYLFVNKKYISTAHDTQYRSGAIGVYTDSDAGSVEAIFRNAQVWKLD